MQATVRQAVLGFAAGLGNSSSTSSIGTIRLAQSAKQVSGSIESSSYIYIYISTSNEMVTSIEVATVKAGHDYFQSVQ